MRQILKHLKDFKLVFFLLPIIYGLLYAFDGWDDSDRGFIPALCHRIVNGELPYLDFLYVRPPGTPFVHALEMAILPDNIEMLGMRLNFYLFEWLAVLFAVLTLRRFFSFKELGIPMYMFASLAFVMMVHNFPAMPWHTADGVFFGALGIFLVTKSGKYYHLIPGLFAMGMAGMCKQNFALTPVAGIALLFVLYPPKRAIIATVGGIGAGLAALLLLEVVTPGESILKAMINQSTGSSSLSDASWGGWQLYVRPAAATLIPLGGLYYLLKVRMQWAHTGKLFAAIFFLMLVVAAALPIPEMLEKETFTAPKQLQYNALLFLGGFLAIFYFFFRNRTTTDETAFKARQKGLAVIVCMCVVGWSVGISWGYAIPALFILPAMFMFVWFLGKKLQFRAPVWFYPSIIGLCFALFYVGSWYTFRDGSRVQLTHHLGDLFPKLNYIYTTEESYEKHEEVKELHAQYGDNFTVMPSFPHAHYVLDVMPPLQIDWMQDAEMGYEKGMGPLVERLETVRPVVFVQKDKEKKAWSKEHHYKSTLLKYVLDNWNMIGETKYFKVYAQQSKTPA
ncbi:MAG: hypothetical protein AAF570_03610 [Bacteroidota bacterium]